MRAYAVLGIHRECLLSDIRMHYTKAIRTAHPDKGGDANRAAELNLAYAAIGNIDAKHAYDKRMEVIGKRCAECGGRGRRGFGKASALCALCGGEGYDE